MSDAELIKVMHAIRGAPATILLLLLLRGGAAMTNLEMQDTTGFSDRTITKSMNVLNAYGFTQFNGRLHGWSLRSGLQLTLPFGDFLAESYPQAEGSYPQAEGKEIVNSTIYDPEIVNFTIYRVASRL